MNKMKPKVISEKTVYKSPLTKVIAAKVRLSNGNIVDWEYIDHADGVAVLPLDRDGNVYLCKEWRLAWSRELIQIPAGTCATDNEKVRIQQVHNELREEIGMDARKVEKLIAYYNSGKINYMPHIYLATDLFPSPKTSDESEIINIVKMPFNEAYEKFISGKEPTSGLTLIAFLMAKEKLSK